MAPANDNFASAEILSPPAGGSTTGTTLDATKEGSEPTIASAHEQSVWYKITPAVGGMYVFTIPQATLVDVGDTVGSASVRLLIFNETVDTLPECTNDNTLPSGFQSDTVGTSGGSDGNLKVQLYAGNTYYIKVQSNSSSAVSNDTVCNFDFEWELITTGPANDDLTNAESFTSVPDTIAGTTKNASTEVGEQAEFGIGEDQSVWYEFTPASDGLYRFEVHNIVADSDGGTYAGGLAVYEGGSTHGSLVIVTKTGIDDDETEEAVRAQLVSGTSYKIKVYSPNYAFNNMLTFDFDITVEEIVSPGAPPANDDIANPQDLGLNPSGVTVGTSVDATYEAFEEAVNYLQPSVWYKFTIDSASIKRITLTKTGTDPDWKPYAELFTLANDPPGDFTDINFYESIGDDFHDDTVAYTDIELEPGEYYLLVLNWDFDGSWDDFEIQFDEVTSPPPNDEYASRVELPYSYKACIEGTTAGATTQFSEPSPSQPSVWYEYAPPNYWNEPLNLQIDTEGSDVGTDTYIHVYTGNLGSFTTIASDHDSGAGGKSKVTFSTNGDVTYKIRVSSPLGSEGDFKLNVQILPGGTPPANDDFEDAEVLSGYSDSASGTTVGATGECGEPVGIFGGELTNTVWYKWVPPQTGRVRLAFETLNSDGLSLFVARGASFETLQRTDFGMGSDGSEEVDYLSVEGGVDYYFIVQGNGGVEDTFDLSFLMSSASAPTNDEPDNATIISPVPTTGGSINGVTEGANFDSEGPLDGNFITETDRPITIWYKIVPTAAGYMVINWSTSSPYNGDFANDGFLRVWRGDDPSSLTQITSSIGPTSNPFVGDTVEFNLDVGETYWISIESSSWLTAASISYSMVFEDDTDDFNPDAETDGTGPFDSVTGSFVADDEDNEYVASGGVGYGTIAPFTDSHFPWGWWCRFYLRSTSGDYLYRYGQTQQHIEVFRAIKTSGDYHSLYVIGHKTGSQSLGVGVNGSITVDTDYKVWGLNKQGTVGKIRIELGENGLNVDGRTMQLPGEIFRDDPSDQFTEFRFGIITYPDDGTSYVDLDPEWNMRYSGIRIHDDPEINVLGNTNEDDPEITAMHGFTTGELLPNSGYSFQLMAPQNPPTVVISQPPYDDGYSLDCSVDTTVGNDIYPCGITHMTSQGIYRNPFIDPANDSYFPGMSLRFLVRDMPSEDVIIAAITMPVATFDSNYNGTFLILGDDGTLYIKPSYDTPPIPFCQTEVGRWNYIELQADTHQRRYATKIWLDDVSMGRFEASPPPLSTTRYPLRPPHWGIYKVGRLGDPFSMASGDFGEAIVEIEFRDIAITRRKVDRPLGPTIIIPKILTGTGVHNYPDPNSFEPEVPNIAGNTDFSGGTDGAGQPHYWTGYDRHDTTTPGGAMFLGYLFQTFGDSLVTQATDGTGPPGFESENALSIEVIAQDQDHESYSAAAYVFGGATEPAVDLTYTYNYADTLSAQFWIKGIAGKTIRMQGKSAIGDIPNYNSVTMQGGWEHIKLYLHPASVFSGVNVTALTLEFPDSDIGDVYLIKHFELFENPENEPPDFYQSANDGVTTERIPYGDTDSWQYIDEFPPSENADQIYMNGDTLLNKVRGREDDGKTHLPPMFSDAYLEYEFGDTPGPEPAVYGAKLLIGLKGYSAPDPNDNVDFNNFFTGATTLVIANEDGSYRYAGTHFNKIHSSDSTHTIYGIPLPRPPGDNIWTITQWNAFLLRMGFHDDVFENSFIIIGDYTNAGVVTGVAAELLTFDRRLFPPLCVRPVDLSRIRFRAWEQNEIDD